MCRVMNEPNGSIYANVEMRKQSIDDDDDDDETADVPFHRLRSQWVSY